MQTTSLQEPNAETLNPPRRGVKPNFVLLLGVLSLLCGVVAVVRVCQIILTVGGNNISNDYLDVVPAINRAIGGQISASNFLTSFKVGQHFVALPVVFHLIAAYLFDWNARAELFMGVGLNIVKTVLLWDLLAHGYKKEWRLLILGGILALVFSMTQASVHFFGQASFPVGLCTLGFTIALWGVIRFKDWRGVLLMLAGGVGSAASMGNVPACWAALLVALVLFGYRLKERNVYFAWLGGAVVSMAPYLYFHAVRPAVLDYCRHPFDVLFFINMLGRPFANQIGLQVGRLPMSEFAGVAGLIMFVIAIAANLRTKNFSVPVKTSLALCAYGLASDAMLSCVRWYVCPWYTTFAIYFWIGLFGLLISALQSDETTAGHVKPYGARSLGYFFKVACLLCLVVIPVIYGLSNRSWKDKHVYLNTRSPASEAGLRNFREAPSYIEGTLFQWGDGRPKNVTDLALPLERHQLSAFAPDQTWTLQGDFILSRVRVFNSAKVPPVRFIEDQTADHTVPWSHYEHANIYVHAPNSVSWTVALPADVRAAFFKSALTIGSPNKRLKPVITDGVSGQIFAFVENAPGSAPNKELLQEVHATKAGQWLPIEIDLLRFKGKTVTLVFTANGGKGADDDISVFRYPTIDVKLPKRSKEENKAVAERLSSESVLWRPRNTDLNAEFGKEFDPQGTLELPSLTSAEWRREPLKVAMPTDIRGVEKGCSDYLAMYFTPKKSIPVSDFTHLLVSMNAPWMFGRSLKVSIVPEVGKVLTISIPLPGTTGTHTSSYDLKLCELPPGSRIKQLVLYPAAAPGSETKGTITINSVSLAKEKTPFWWEELGK